MTYEVCSVAVVVVGLGGVSGVFQSLYQGEALGALAVEPADELCSAGGFA
ncbi:hypothetical protein ACWC9T_06620 [Kitasatospora sp. NPDC001159]